MNQILLWKTILATHWSVLKSQPQRLGTARGRGRRVLPPWLLLGSVLLCGCTMRLTVSADGRSDARLAGGNDGRIDAGTGKTDVRIACDGDACGDTADTDSRSAVSVCGDGVREGQEQCDDRNVSDGDGCDSNCQIEPGWHWVVLPETRCLDGSATGLGVRRTQNASKLVIYLQEGGACFNPLSCLATRKRFAETDFDSWIDTYGSSGLFNRELADNPFADFDQIFVPYCSGDVFAGNNVRQDVSGMGPSGQAAQAVHRGYRNVQDVISWTAERFAPSQVVVAGSSAGGFGALFNGGQVRAVFSKASLTILSDSGAVFSEGYLAPCETETWRQLWNFDGDAEGFDGTLPSKQACPECYVDTDGNGRPDRMLGLLENLAKNQPRTVVGVISSLHDQVIRLFFAGGYRFPGRYTGDCNDIFPMPADTFEQGLCDLRSGLTQWNADRYRVHYRVGSHHIWLADDDWFDPTLRIWVSELLNEQASDVVAEGACD